VSENMTALVTKLRGMSGAGILECKKALEETKGDLDKAMVILRERGATKALSKSSRSTKAGVIASYIHAGDRVGVLLELNCETDFVAKTDEFKALAKELCLQVAAASPRWVKPDNVPAEVVAQEQDIYRKQLLQDDKNKGKPGNVLDKIVEGRMTKFYEETCLLEQPYVRDASGKQKIKDLLVQTIAKVGENITVRRFARYVLGEE